MKKLVLFAVLSVAVFAAEPASSADLVGVWSVEADCVLAGGGDAEGPLPRVRIEGQTAEGLFWGFAGDDPQGQDPPNTDLSGAVVGKEVYMTFWDATVHGTLMRGGREIFFVAQIQDPGNPDDPPERSSHTCVGIATRQ